MVNRVTDELTRIIEPVVDGLGYEFVGLEYFPQGARSLMRIYIDTPAGVTVDDCERVSHQVSGVLDVENPVHGHYTLEVSSPGVDRPLFTKEHYERFRGKTVAVRLSVPSEGRRKFTGVLEGFEEDNIILLEGESRVSVPFAQIEKGRLVPEYD